MAISIVIVSHSARLAQGIAELAAEMAGSDVRIALASGLDMPGQPLGTDASLIARVIQEVDNPEGVLLLMDLGSAIISAEMALELLPKEMQTRVMLCPAPLVEGALAAAVQARLGSSLQEVYEEALAAAEGKRAQLGAAVPQPQVPRAATSDSGLTLRLTVPNKLGFHARPAALLAKTLSAFDAKVRVRSVTRGGDWLSTRSINALITSGIRYQEEIEFVFEGSDATAALLAVQKLADQNFGDDDRLPPTVPKPAPTRNTSKHALSLMANSLKGVVASDGLAIGKAQFLHMPTLGISDKRILDPSVEWERFEAALKQVRVKIEATLESAQRQMGRGTASIFEAHLLLLTDEALIEPTRAIVYEQKYNVARAWQTVYERVAESYSQLEDTYLRERAADVRDVGRQVLAVLLNIDPTPKLNFAGILLTDDLTPSGAAALDKNMVKAICTVQGGPTSHSAIIARAMGIPSLVGLGPQLMDIAEGESLIVDAEQGRLWIKPDDKTIAQYNKRIAALTKARAVAQQTAQQPAVTQDGRTIEVVANIGGVKDAQAALAAGADGVGLFRTEFLFLDRKDAPTEEEQYTAYLDVARAFGKRAVIIRTLDVGGDKPLPYIDLGKEANPFLGWRALRVSLEKTEMFREQLRAILRVAADYPVKLMFPMVATLDELRLAREQVQIAHNELSARGVPSGGTLETGIMIEIPSAALCADVLAREADFFSVGTNDLTQYVMAAERGNPHVSHLSDALHPAVLKLMYQVAQAAVKHGKWAGVCGEVASDPLATLPLVGMGYTELSMSASAIALVKQAIRNMKQNEISGWIPSLFEQESAEAVRVMLRAKMQALQNTL